MKVQRHFLPLLFVLTISFTAFSQPKESYTEVLVRANKMYEQGNFADAIALATSCTTADATVSDRWKAQRLLAMTYLADGQTDKARQSAENMLELNPTYKPSYLNDPTELIRLLKSITVIPKFSLGLALSLGTNTVFPEIPKGYSLSNYQKTYSSQSSFQFGLSLGYTLNTHMAIDLGLYASQKAYAISYEVTNWNVEVSERLTYMDFPVMFKYTIFPEKRMRLYTQAGVYAGYLLFSGNDFSSTHTPDNKKYELTDLNSAPRRNTYNLGLAGGIGVAYKTGRGHLFLQANYFNSFSNITNDETRYKYSDLTYTYFYADDDVILHNLAISLGYSFYMSYKVIRN